VCPRLGASVSIPHGRGTAGEGVVAQVLGQPVEHGGVADSGEGVALLAEFDALGGGAAFDGHGGVPLG